ncbi:MAG: dihydroorotate dehydrogenase electron transfer subunit [Syntrophobacteria bacterium]
MPGECVLLEDAEILFNESLEPELYHMGLRSPEIAARIQPGQFLMVRVQQGFDPLLRRPFAVHRLHRGKPRSSFEVLYRVVGRGTRLLAGMHPATSLSLLGPLGRGFRPPEKDGCIVMVAGGIGIAPLPFLSETLVKSGFQGPFLLWFGGKTARDLVCLQHFEELGFAVELFTEDGSAGRKGLVTEHLEFWLTRKGHLPRIIYSCGPYPMQRRVAQLAARLGIPSQLSMETLMACGVGACLGCSLKCRSEAGAHNFYYANVCQQGPVFAGEEIIWDEAGRNVRPAPCFPEKDDDS